MIVLVAANACSAYYSIFYADKYTAEINGKGSPFVINAKTNLKQSSAKIMREKIFRIDF